MNAIGPNRPAEALAAYQALLLTMDGLVAERVAAALAGLAQLHRRDPTEEAALLALSELRPVLLLVDAEDAGERLSALLAQLRRAAPAAALVALGDEADAALALRCLRGGATDLLPREGGEAALRRALRPQLDRTGREAVPNRRSPVWALLGARPADPSRLLALGLAAHRARAGREVLFLDLAEGARETDIALDLEPGYGVAEALDDLDRLDAALLGAAVRRHQGGKLSALVLGEEARPEAMADAPALLGLLRAFYDEVVLHAPLGLAAAQPGLVLGANGFAVVAEQSLAAALAAARPVRRLVELGAEQGLLAIAHHDRRVAPDPRALAAAIGLPAVVPLPEARATLANAANQGRFAAGVAADRRLVRGLGELGRALGMEQARKRRGWFRAG